MLWATVASGGSKFPWVFIEESGETDQGRKFGSDFFCWQCTADRYLMYWGKLNGAEMTQFCSAILTNSEKSSSQCLPERYFLLSDHLPEDKRLRNMLREIKLKTVTRAKEQERADTSFSRKCVYCYKIISGGLHEMFNHLTNVHNFSIGKPDNIVFGAKLLDAMEAKLQKLLCVYCEKKFTDVEVLRLHMRKKGHRSLNPNNRFYDQFYLINYLQPGTPWQEVKSQRDDETESQESFNEDSIAGGVGVSHSLDDQWTDWREDEAQSGTCLFCSYTTCKLPAGLLQHMSSQHDCDLLHLTHNFSFYDKVKAVNYIRTMIKQLQCPACGKSPGDEAALQEHLTTAGHCKLPTPALWCSRKYLQPVLVEDGLLCHLDDCPEAELSEMSECEVFSEDVTSPAVVSEDVARELSVEVQRVSCVSVMCLFCRHTAFGGPSVGCNGVRELVDHMHNMHGFDLYQMTLGKDFYEQLCLINFIRRRSSESRCYYCGEHFTDPRLLEEHRTVEGHTGPPDPALYRRHEFMSPVVEDDPLLMGLDQPTWNSDSELEDDVVPSQPISDDTDSVAGRRKGSRNNKTAKKKGHAKDSRKSSIMLLDVAAQNLVKEMNDGLQSALSSSKGHTIAKNALTDGFTASGIAANSHHDAPQNICSYAGHSAVDDRSESLTGSSSLYNVSMDGGSQCLDSIGQTQQDQTSLNYVLHNAASDDNIGVVSSDLNCSHNLKSGADGVRKSSLMQSLSNSLDSAQRSRKNSEQFFHYGKCCFSATDMRIGDSSPTPSNDEALTVENDSVSILNNIACLNGEGSDVTNTLNSFSLSTSKQSRASLELINHQKSLKFYIPPIARQGLNTLGNHTSIPSSSSKSNGKPSSKSTNKQSFHEKTFTLTHRRQGLLPQQTTTKFNDTSSFECTSREYNHASASQLVLYSSSSKISPMNGVKQSTPARDFNSSWRRPNRTSEIGHWG
ncbi:Zinc finger C2H2-type [Trinorchestia longiramus]|nr:Zinc finger C2H2-type [Trinorchestia longiramus]